MTFEGLAVFRKDFVAYQLIGTSEESETGPSADPILAFGGKGYDFGTPSGKTYAFTLLPDVKGVLAPFAGPDSFPVVDLSTDENGNYIKPLPVISDLLYREKGVNDQSRAVWLQTSLYINTTPGNSDNGGFDQQSFVNVALGGVDPTTGGLVGARRGGSSVDVTQFDITPKLIARWVWWHSHHTRNPCLHRRHRHPRRPRWLAFPRQGRAEHRHRLQLHGYAQYRPRHPASDQYQFPEPGGEPIRLDLSHRPRQWGATTATADTRWDAERLRRGNDHLGHSSEFRQCRGEQIS